MNVTLSRSRVRASSGLLDGRSLASSLTRYIPDGKAVVSQANVFSVIGSSESSIHSGQPSLRTLSVKLRSSSLGSLASQRRFNRVWRAAPSAALRSGTSSRVISGDRFDVR